MWTIKVYDPRTKQSALVVKSWRLPWPVEGSSKLDMGVVEAPTEALAEACATPEPTPDSGTPA